MYNQVFETDIKYNLFFANYDNISEDEETTFANKLKENTKISGTVYIRTLNKITKKAYLD